MLFRSAARHVRRVCWRDLLRGRGTRARGVRWTGATTARGTTRRAGAWGPWRLRATGGRGGAVAWVMRTERGTYPGGPRRRDPTIPADVGAGRGATRVLDRVHARHAGATHIGERIVVIDRDAAARRGCVMHGVTRSRRVRVHPPAPPRRAARGPRVPWVRVRAGPRVLRGSGAAAEPAGGTDHRCEIPAAGTPVMPWRRATVSAVTSRRRVHDPKATGAAGVACIDRASEWDARVQPSSVTVSSHHSRSPPWSCNWYTSPLSSVIEK